MQPSISITRAENPKGFRLFAEQLIPQPREQVLGFFADALNVQTITPPWLNFKVLTPEPILMRQGTLIDYQLRLHGVALRWRSRISVWEPSDRFVDEQVRGPYRHWHHEHIFMKHADGTLCQDIVHYAAPGGWLADWLLVRRDLLKIFSFRQQQLQSTFKRTAESS